MLGHINSVSKGSVIQLDVSTFQFYLLRRLFHNDTWEFLTNFSWYFRVEHHPICMKRRKIAWFDLFVAFFDRRYILYRQLKIE